MTCPRCKTPDVVSKSEAWDALNVVPPSTQERLNILEPMAIDARMVASQCGQEITGDALCLAVPIEHLNALRAHFGMDRI